MSAKDKMYLNSMLFDLIEVAFERQRIKKDFYNSSFPKAFLNEFCTVRLQGPRGSGHTTESIRIIESYHFLNSILIFPNVHMADNAMSNHIYYKKDRLHKRVFSSKDLDNDRLRGLKTIQLVVVENFSFGYSNSQRKKIFEIAQINMEKCYEEDKEFVLALVG